MHDALDGQVNAEKLVSCGLKEDMLRVLRIDQCQYMFSDWRVRVTMDTDKIKDIGKKTSERVKDAGKDLEEAGKDAKASVDKAGREVKKSARDVKRESGK